MLRAGLVGTRGLLKHWTFTRGFRYVMDINGTILTKIYHNPIHDIMSKEAITLIGLLGNGKSVFLGTKSK